MPYHLFSPKDAALFADKHSDLFGDHSQLTAQLLGSNTLNQVFRVKNNRGTSLIVKQALPDASVFSKHWPISSGRIQIEADVLKHHHRICPDHVVEVLFYDAELCAMVLEDLSDSEQLSHVLHTEQYTHNVATDIGRYLARTSFYTSDFVLTGPVKKARQLQFSNPEFCLITEDLVFTDPYCNHERNSIPLAQLPEIRELWLSEQLLAEVAQLKSGFLAKPQALLHGDLHCGNVMVSHEYTKVIAAQYGYYGPIGFDVGTFLASLILSLVAQAPQKHEHQRQYLVAQIELLWHGFAQQFQQLMQKETTDQSFQSSLFHKWYLEQVWQDTLGYAGCELIRRTVGWAPSAELQQIRDPALKHHAQQHLLSLGRQLIEQRRALALSDLLRVLSS